MTYRLVQGKAQTAMFIQHKESPLPFLSQRVHAIINTDTLQFLNSQKAFQGTWPTVKLICTFDLLVVYANEQC